MRRPQRLSIKNLFLFAIIILMVSFYSGLAAQEESADRDTETITEEVSDSNESESEESTDAGYVYDPTDKTDPFQSFIAVAEEREEAEKKKPKTYLETLELSQLDLSVIVVGPSGKWAMVTDSKDVGHVIKEGTPIGTNGGVVYKIQKGEVIIREEYKDFRGNMQYREISKKSPSFTGE